MNSIIVNIEYLWYEMKIEVDPKESVRHIIGKILQKLQEIEIIHVEVFSGNWELEAEGKNGEDPKILGFYDEEYNERCLFDYNIQNGDCLQLSCVPVAGDGHDLSYYLDESNSKTTTNNSGLSNCPIPVPNDTAVSYYPTPPIRKNRFGEILRNWITTKKEVYASIFAPTYVKRSSHMIVQVFLHPYEETEKVKTLAQESQKDAERRDYIPLQCILKKGNKVDVILNIYGETMLMSDKKSVVWQGSFTKCGFDYFVPKDIDMEELSCVALLTVNEIPIGEMRFITKVVDAPRQLNTEIIAHKFNKVFISYSHLDEEKVKFYHEGLELAKVPHFFDRSYLKAGDVFPQVIQNYINSADLFILFWSENASKSEYVEKERKQALERAFPQVKPQQAAKLSIYPMSIEPRAELPSDMKDNYHFGVI